MYSIQKSKSAIYPISGLKQIIRNKGDSYELISFKLYDGYVEIEVDDNEVIKLLLIIKNVIKNIMLFYFLILFKIFIFYFPPSNKIIF